MAHRVRIGHCLFITASGRFQSWARNEDDLIVWRTFPTIEKAAEWRDKKRKERAELLKTPRRIRVARRLEELLNPKPKPDEWTRLVVEYDENHDPYADPPFPWRQ